MMEKYLNLLKYNKAVLLTGDLGFGNLLHFPLGTHSGIFIAHFPNEISTI